MKQEPNQKTSYKSFNSVSYIKLILILLLSFSNTMTLFCQPLTAEQIYEKVKDAVVVILAYDYSNELAAQGSSVVLNDKGYVVTNYHVLSGNQRLEIMHGDEIIPYVDIIGIDVEKDILILKIEEKKFPAMKIGDVKKLKVGQRVYAIGSPMGFENTISEGIISGLRSYDKLSKNYIQITASISPGSSGGAVVNDKGELIGISTSTVKEGQNLNFAIPIDAILGVEISSYSKNDAYKNFEWFYNGYDEYNKGNYKESIKYFTSYIKEFPNDVRAYYNRGIAKIKLEDYRGAIQDYNKAIEIDPNFVDAYNNRGVAKNKLEDYIGATQDYNKAIEIDPNYEDAYYNRGLVKYGLEDYIGATKDFNKAIELNPNHYLAYIYRGIVIWSVGKFKEAIEDYNKAIEINPNDYLAYYYRGQAKGSLEDIRGSMQDYNKAIEINPNDSKSYLKRGAGKFLLGDKAGACLDWSKAGELGDDSVYYYIKEFCN